MITRLTLVVGALVAALLAGPASPALAASLTQDARSLRTSVVQLTQDYEREYGPRVSAAERAELTSLSAQARRQMTALVGAIRKAERSNRAADWRAARSVHASALAAAETNFERAAALLQPRLSLGEQLRAYSDYTRTLREFQQLGDQIPGTAAR